MNRLEGCIYLRELQFGFARGGECNNALLFFKSVVEYFNLYGSIVFAAALDLSKAYDKLNQSQLILKLYDMGISKDIIFMFTY